MRKFLPLIPALIILTVLMFPSGCANTTTPPTGGDKDTIPPVRTPQLPRSPRVRLKNLRMTVICRSDLIKINNCFI